MMKKILITCISVTLAVHPALSQQTAIKSNILYNATTTFNIGVEQRVGRYLTVDFPVNYNPWTFSDNKKIKHIMVQPELRYWLVEPFNRGFLGVHGMYAFYNAGGVDLPLGLFPGLKKHRYEGWLLGLGASYGYQWFLSPHWSIEATGGLGYAYFEFDRYPCLVCSPRIDSSNKHYFGITKVGVSIIYLFNNGMGIKNRKWAVEKNIPARIR